MRRHISRGDEVLVQGRWYEVTGFALTHKPGGIISGDVFTDKPHGTFEPCLGYRLNYHEIEDVRAGRSALAQSEEKK